MMLVMKVMKSSNCVKLCFFFFTLLDAFIYCSEVYSAFCLCLSGILLEMKSWKHSVHLMMPSEDKTQVSQVEPEIDSFAVPRTCGLSREYQVNGRMKIQAYLPWLHVQDASDWNILLVYLWRGQEQKSHPLHPISQLMKIWWALSLFSICFDFWYHSFLFWFLLSLLSHLLLSPPFWPYSDSCFSQILYEGTLQSWSYTTDMWIHTQLWDELSRVAVLLIWNKLEENVDPSSQSHGLPLWERDSPIQNEWMGWKDISLSINSSSSELSIFRRWEASWEHCLLLPFQVSSDVLNR